MSKITSISITKKKSKPTWEDEINKEGCEFSVIINRSSDNEMQELWTKLVIKTIGCQYQYAENVITF